MKAVSIAIDGPSGAGKSTLAKRLAERLGFVYVDTGAIYRTIGLRALRSGVDPKDESAVAAMLDQVHLEIRYGEDGLQHMMLDGEDVTKDIRLPEVSRYASLVSAHPCVRDYLLEMQRSLARSHCVIMDGRDIGTVVLPNADVKIFLTAIAAAWSWSSGEPRSLSTRSFPTFWSGTKTIRSARWRPCARRRTLCGWIPHSWTLMPAWMRWKS